MWQRRSVVAAVAGAALLYPAAALATGDHLPLAAWMQRMTGDDQPAAVHRLTCSPEMQQMMAQPEMEQMMRSPEMQRMMEASGMGHMMESSSMRAMISGRLHRHP